MVELHGPVGRHNVLSRSVNSNKPIAVPMPAPASSPAPAPVDYASETISSLPPDAPLEFVDLAAVVSTGAVAPQAGINAFEALEATNYLAGVDAEQAIWQADINRWADLHDNATDPKIKAVALANRDRASFIADQLFTAHEQNFAGNGAMLSAMDAVLTKWEQYNQWAATQTVNTLLSYVQWEATL